jgi:hypothetical protein
LATIHDRFVIFFLSVLQHYSHSLPSQVATPPTFNFSASASILPTPTPAPCLPPLNNNPAQGRLPLLPLPPPPLSPLALLPVPRSPVPQVKTREGTINNALPTPPSLPFLATLPERLTVPPPPRQPVPSLVLPVEDPSHRANKATTLSLPPAMAVLPPPLPLPQAPNAPPSPRTTPSLPTVTAAPNLLSAALPPLKYKPSNETPNDLPPALLSPPSTRNTHQDMVLLRLSVRSAVVVPRSHRTNKRNITNLPVLLPAPALLPLLPATPLLHHPPPLLRSVLESISAAVLDSLPSPPPPAPLQWEEPPLQSVLQGGC